MTSLPIIFNAAMVRATLAGRKTQHRGLLKPQPTIRDDRIEWGGWTSEQDAKTMHIPSMTRWRPGDTLYVREAWRTWRPRDHISPSALFGSPVEYLASDNPDDGEDRALRGRSRQAIHLPRWASRITLTVDAARVEKLHQMTDWDALSEGVAEFVVNGNRRYGVHAEASCLAPVMGFARLWDTTRTAGHWNANPWVSVTTFKRVGE